jgi:excisionase family DNA binding protein
MNALEDYNDVLKPKEVQEILHISRSTLYKYLENGTIWAVKLGDSYRIPKQTLIDFLYPDRKDARE